MDKRLFCLILIAYVTLLIGCSGTTKVDADYRTGTGTLQLSFDSRMPPSSLNEQEQNAVIVVAKNTGGHVIDSGKIALTTDDSVLYLGTKEGYTEGGQPQTVRQLVQSANQPLMGKSVVAPSGDQRSYAFDVYALPLPQESQKRTAGITAYACFEYETFQHAQVCIDFDPYNSVTSAQVKPACQLTDVSPETGGGPVNVNQVQTRLEVQDGEVRANFYMTIDAPSNLKFFSPGDEQSFCDSRAIRSTTPDTVYLSAWLSDQPLGCDLPEAASVSHTYVVSLINNKAKVSCFTPQPLFARTGDSTSNYLAPLTVNLTYGVVATASKTITVNAVR